MSKLYQFNGKEWIEIKGRDGLDGVSPVVDYPTIINEVLNKIPLPKNGQNGSDGSPDTPDQVTEKVNQSLIPIRKDRIEGIADLERMLSYQGGGTGVTTTVFFKNGTQVGRAKNINFIEGTNVTITTYQTGDQLNVSFSATGSSGSGYQQPTGTVNGSNQVFVFATAPNVLSVDNGRIMQKTSSDGTINWTGTTTVTLAIAPNSDIFGIS